MGANCCNFSSSETKIVMYGPGNSGKTTVQKAVRMAMALNQSSAVTDTYSADQLRTFEKGITENIITSTAALVREAQRLFPDECQAEPALTPLGLISGVRDWSILSEKQAAAIVTLWNPPVGLLQRTFQALPEGTVYSNATYFLPRAARIAARNEGLCEDDILQLRIQTNNMQVFEVPYLPEKEKGCCGLGPEKQPPAKMLQMLDLGGQADQQKKQDLSDAFNVFRKSSTAIFLLVPIGDFDIIDSPAVSGSSRIDKAGKIQGVDRFQQSLMKLDQILSKESRSTWHSTSKTLHIFMNKCDILRDKIEKRGARGMQVAAYEDEQGYPWARPQKELAAETAAISEYIAKLGTDIEALEQQQRGTTNKSGSSSSQNVSKSLKSMRQTRQDLEATLVSLRPDNQRYSGPANDADAAYAYFEHLVEQRIHGAIRRGLYSWPNVQYHIHKTTAVDFAEMRDFCIQLVKDFFGKAFMASVEMGIIEEVDTSDNPISGRPIMEGRSAKDTAGSRSDGGAVSAESSTVRAKATTSVATSARQIAKKRVSVFDISTQYAVKDVFGH